MITKSDDGAAEARIVYHELNDTKSDFKLLIKLHFEEKKNSRVKKERENLQEDLQSFCPITVSYNFECDWLIELSDNKFSDNKLPDNNLTGKLVENRSFF